MINLNLAQLLEGATLEDILLFIIQAIVDFIKVLPYYFIIFLIVVIVIRLLLGYLLQTVAHTKGYKGIGVLALFLLFPTFALLYTIALPDRERRERQEASA